MTPIYMQPFYQSLQDIIRGSEPAPKSKPIACNICLDTGCTESGRPCGWCRLGDQWDGVIDGTED